MGIYLHVSVDKLRTLFFNYFFIYKISIYKIFYALKERKTKNIDFSVRMIRKIMFYVYFSDKKIFRVCRALFWNILCIFLNDSLIHEMCTRSLVLRIQPSLLWLLLVLSINYNLHEKISIIHHHSYCALFV